MRTVIIFIIVAYSAASMLYYSKEDQNIMQQDPFAMSPPPTAENEGYSEIELWTENGIGYYVINSEVATSSLLSSFR